ncbi:hypothetical protein [Arthrobacter sp. UYEF20]|uniref:hypothetical protein n=1 Tax=Arthrobacter sp. UYEF20 TaxID=1756363 RepID=UPI0033980D4F
MSPEENPAPVKGPGRKKQLSRGDGPVHALALVDAEGLDALMMRRLGRAAGPRTTAKNWNRESAS